MLRVYSTVHLHYIGRQAMTLHSRVERDSFMLLLLANKLVVCAGPAPPSRSTPARTLRARTQL